MTASTKAGRDRSLVPILALFLAAAMIVVGCGGDSPTPPDVVDSLNVGYDKITFLTSHNAFAYFDWDEAIPDNGLCVNQQTTIAEQLDHGVRAFQLDLHHWEDPEDSAAPVLWLCHGSREVPLPPCHQLQFAPLADELEVIAAFLASHPEEVVTLLFEDYVEDEQLLLGALQAAQLPGMGRSLYNELYSPSGSAWNVSDRGSWPTIRWMVDQSSRLVVFSDVSYDEIARSGDHIYSNSWDSIDFGDIDCHLSVDPRDHPNELFMMYHLSGPKLMNGWNCPELSTVWGPDVINAAEVIMARYLASCASEVGHPPNFLSVDFADGCPDGETLCDRTMKWYDGPFDAARQMTAEF